MALGSDAVIPLSILTLEPFIRRVKANTAITGFEV